jgi:hypothetical protein
MAINSKWMLIVVVPNLPLKTAKEFAPFAFVPNDDERLKEIRQTSKAAAALLNNFKNNFGRPCPPSALIMEKNAPDRFREWSVIVDLRNAFAIASICGGWQHKIGNLNVWWPLYSDYFDIYPFYPHSDGTGLVHLGQGLSSYDSAAKFIGQPHPDLPTGTHWNFDVTPDERLLPPLIQLWKQRAERNRRDWKNEALFRSLAVAFRAARLAKGSDNQMFDLGIQLSLWVSAHECLIHPGNHGRAGLNAVWDLLAKRRWVDPELQIKSRMRYSRGKPDKTRPLNYVQKLYFRLYRARNAFLHGNPVKRDLLFIGNTNSDSVFIQVAPLVYQTALEARLLPHQKRRRHRKLEEVIRIAFRFRGLESALLKTKERRKDLL